MACDAYLHSAGVCCTVDAGLCANAVNDALDPLGVSLDRLPMSHPAIWERIAAAGNADRHTQKAEEK